MKESEIKDYYPTNFEIELNSCKNEHEGIPIIPFVDPIKINKEYNKVENKIKNIIEKNNIYKDGKFFIIQ